MTIPPEAVAKLQKDVRAAAVTLSDREARFLVDAYYMIQEHRIEAESQLKALIKNKEPNEILQWLFDQNRTLEAEISKVLNDYTDQSRTGLWSKSILGIAHTLTAGLLAHIEIEKAPTVGHVWRFAGLDPTVSWNKGEKRPWNASLKVLCWKIGESFVKVSGRPCVPGHEMTYDDFGYSQQVIAAVTDKPGLPVCHPNCANYGHVYLHRKALETMRNERGDYKEQAEQTLATKKIRKTTPTYKEYERGKLPKARIHARAKRYATKLFLAHFHHVLHEDRFGTPPPKPYIIEHGGHAHYIAPPKWPI